MLLPLKANGKEVKNKKSYAFYSCAPKWAIKNLFSY
jgi:hypothetical protein